MSKESNEFFRCEDKPKDRMTKKIDQVIKKLESNEAVNVPNVRSGTAEFNDSEARWVMPKKFVQWDKSKVYGERFLKLLKALKELLISGKKKKVRDLFYNLIMNRGVFLPEEGLSEPYDALRDNYLLRVEALTGAERENLNILGGGRGYIWAPRGKMSTPKRENVDLASAPAIRNDVRSAALTNAPDTIITVEKTGEQETLENSGIAEVLDFMVVVPKGRSNREALRFLKKCEREGKRIFSLNDSDVAGLSMPLEMMGLSKSSAHLGDDFRPDVDHIGIFGRVLDEAGISGIPESSSDQKEDAMEKAVNLDKGEILAELEYIDETGTRFETSALDPYEKGLETYLIEAFRAFGLYDDKKFDPDEISAETVREKVPAFVWKRIKSKGDIDAGDLKDQATVKREFKEDGWIKTRYPGSEVRQIIDDWKEEKAEEYLDEEGPELPEKSETKDEAENVLSGLPDELFRNLAIEEYNSDPLTTSPSNDSVAKTARDKMLSLEKTVKGEAEYEIEKHETPEGKLKVEITVGKPDFTAKVGDPEIEEIEDPEPGDVTTPYDYTHDKLGTPQELGEKIKKGFSEVS